MLTKPLKHFFILLGIISIGAGFRFWNLDLKPLWMDEVITALFSLGRSYYDVPLEQFFNVSSLNQLFQWRPSTCANIAQTIAVQSVHPPLFFCWLHQWVQFVPGSWIWQLRSFSATAGIAAIIGVYLLNRVAFSKSAGTIAALIMAVSPFAVYLSQEARHYMVPMLFVIGALIGLIRIQQDLCRQQLDLKVWIGWIIVNGIGFYVHYFFVLAIAAQFFALIVLQARLTRSKFWWRTWSAIGFSGLGMIGIALPWLPTLLSHMSRPETDWLATTSAWWSFLAPLYQLFAGWIVMTIALPVEYQPVWIIVLSGATMLLFNGWLGWHVLKGLKRLLSDPQTHWETLTLMSFVVGVLLEFLAVVYILNKDITQVPRYNFIYYPAVCALLAASIGKLNQRSGLRSKTLIVAIAGAVSCIFVVTNLVFLKPYNPDRVAATISSRDCATVVMGYDDFQEIALGLGFALALQTAEKQFPQHCQPSSFAFTARSPNYDSLWRKLSTLTSTNAVAWAIAPGLRKRDFPAQITFKDKTCRLNSAQQYRIGIPYSRYDCK